MEEKTKPNRSRSCQINIRVSEEERAKIDKAAEASGMKSGEYVRALATGGVRIDRRELQQVIGQLGKIGSNLNQIARHLNSGGSPQGQDVSDALEHLASVLDEITDLRKSR